MLKSITSKLLNVATDFKNDISWVENQINTTLANVFYDNKLNLIAKKTNFVQRSSSRLQGNEFIQAMVMASIDPESSPLSGINDNLRGIHPRAKMTTAALRQRINSTEANQFLKHVYQHVLEQHLKPLTNELNTLKCNQSKGALEYFDKVLLHDSSSCSLNEHLKTKFKGSGGLASKSQVKIDLIYDIKANIIEEITFTDVREPDQALSSKIIKHLSPKVLTIQDLGYFDVGTFAAYSTYDAYYLSRLLGTTLVYLNETDEKPVELGKHLKKLYECGDSLDIEVFITKKKFKIRLLAYRVPEEILNKRLREYYKKNKSKTPSMEWIARQGFTILITNVPREIWSWEVVGTVYKIRWQIELIFKVWKSQMSLDYLKGTNPQRILCLLYSRMLASTLIFTIYGGITNILFLVGCESSLVKFVNWLKRKGRFAKIILKGFTSDLWNELIDNLDLLCKDIYKKSKTTRQLIEEEVPFLEIFNSTHRLCA